MSQYQVPGTPRVISPSPSLSESSGSIKDSYFSKTNGKATNGSVHRQAPIDEESSSSSDPEQRARWRSRSPDALAARRRRKSALKTTKPTTIPYLKDTSSSKQPERPSETNGYLTPETDAHRTWREVSSRSPSPLGLIPIHSTYRAFIHRHEIPRKILHVSIGFLTLKLYTSGYQAHHIHPVLLTLLVPISLTDIIRHHSPRFNRFYIKVLGALMRESEVEGWNGVIWYLLGTFLALRFFPKDVGVVSVLLLSWCDTAASTFGRLWGRYTPKIRQGKSLAGTLAAATCGTLTAAAFWGYVAPMAALGDSDAFAFQGALGLPGRIGEEVTVER